MKKAFSVFLASVCILALAGCGPCPANQESGSGGAPEQSVSPYECQTETGEQAHVHQPPKESNITPHENAGYCGNTVTTVRYEPKGVAARETWEKSFWGGDSVALTDLLRYLAYTGDVCRCIPEYRIDTEFGSDYGVSLSEGYARHDGGQAELTEEQAEEIRDVLERVRGVEDGGVSG